MTAFARSPSPVTTTRPPSCSRLLTSGRRVSSDSSKGVEGLKRTRLPPAVRSARRCQFLALLVAALIERQVRTAMAAAALNHIPLYPEFRDCTAPSTERILEIFTNLTRHQLHRDGILVKTFEPELTTQQQQVLDLFGLAPTAYTQHR